MRVAVKAVGVNPVDYKAYSPDYGRDVSQLPMHLGSEAAGVVVATGEKAEGPAGPGRGRVSLGEHSPSSVLDEGGVRWEPGCPRVYPS